ncbi:Uridylate kinase [Piscirickettsia salmonis]|uniref:Uridylate kinase n=1 Tax=Piscirickettsia salmonis TaxID=1238 RepID=A0A1L6T9N5_PISSA|nr:UMP kinase [Piscirickettsia salmonis]AKP73212.2 UMP kinase [Piscirickettsia salmonis LF-89 = ATCC VR-1361]ALB21899.1 UMP kinase [Piscirickettsia salmonis]ALY02072.1 UMP kinase [Piscirickettsia salmonis]AMA41585.1 UMP kinase [Piscirickettsia salmonis]AOS34068.1 UMP kinase [Piscirickettsia salmonis]
MTAKTSQALKYRRVLLKLSGESLMGTNASGISPKTIERFAHEIKQVMALGVQVGLVIGGGNFLRGVTLSEAGLSRVTGDHMGMLATVINALAMRDVLERIDVPARIMSAIPMSGLVDHYDRRKAMHHLSEGRAVIFAAGTGNPLVTTDSAASLRGIEVDVDLLLKATRVDGVYTADPEKDPTAERYSFLSYEEALKKELGVMDLAAFCQCRDHHLPIRVFNIFKEKSLLRVILGEDEGTLVSGGE